MLLQVEKVSDILGCIRRNAASRERGGFSCLQLKAAFDHEGNALVNPILKILLVFLYYVSRV